MESGAQSKAANQEACQPAPEFTWDTMINKVGKDKTPWLQNMNMTEQHTSPIKEKATYGNAG